jgi:hypothetical protein
MNWDWGQIARDAITAIVVTLALYVVGSLLGL